MSKMRVMIAGVLAAALVVATPAAGSPGNGIRFGGAEGRLHPYFELEPRYDSNVFLSGGSTSQLGSPTGDLILHFRPGVRLEVPGDPIDLRFDGALDWAQYLGVQGNTTGLSRLYGDAVVGVLVNKSGTVSLEADDAFRRSGWTPSLSIAAAVISDLNTLRASVPWAPGGGALVLTTTGEWVLEAFEPFYTGAICDPTVSAICSSSTLAKLGYNELRAREEVKWNFLPRTAALLEVGYFDRLPNSTDYSIAVNGLRVDTGAAGLVTPHFAATVKAGYGDTFGSAGKAFRTWLATVEGEWIGNELVGAKLGYVHDFGSDPGKAFALYDTNRVYADAHLALRMRATCSLRGEWERRDYALSSGSSSQIFRIEPSVEAELARWLKVGAGYVFTKRASDLPAGTTVPTFDYTKHEAFVRATLTY